jgi:DNA polymerase I-like protein with 3'-5' exonuclease and polymerase domains
VRIALDIETNLAHDKIWICSTYNVDTKEAKKWLSPTNEFQNYIQTADLLIAQNGIGFDFPVLNRVWNTKITLKQTRDTLVLSRLANPSREGGHSLGKLATLVGRTKKEFDDFDGGLTEEMAEYCQMDAEICGELYLYLLKELKGFSEQSIELEHRVAAIIGKQEKQGFLLDVVKATTLIADWKCRLSQIEEELQSIFPPIVTERTSEKTGKVLKDKVEYFNAGSRQQIAKRLMEKGWKPTKHTEKGAVIVDESVLSGVDIPEAKAIAEYLLLQKRVSQVSSWLDAVQPDGRVRGKVITNGAISGRATHHSPNMAQIPNIGSEFGKECRECWTVPSGYKLVGVDLAQLELRCLAHYMRDDEYTQELLNGDIHTKNQTAAGLPTRAAAKTFIFATIYGAGPAKIGSIINAGAKEGRQILQRFLDATPSLKKLREKVERLAAQGTLPGIDGRLLHIRSPHSALNTLLQGAGAIISKYWLLEIEKEIRKTNIKAFQVAWVHDEVQFEVEEARAEEFGQLSVEAARRVTDILSFRCPLDAEYHVGNNWMESH